MVRNFHIVEERAPLANPAVCRRRLGRVNSSLTARAMRATKGRTKGEASKHRDHVEDPLEDGVLEAVGGASCLAIRAAL